MISDDELRQNPQYIIFSKVYGTKKADKLLLPTMRQWCTKETESMSSQRSFYPCLVRVIATDQCLIVRSRYDFPVGEAIIIMSTDISVAEVDLSRRQYAAIEASEWRPL